MKRKLFTVVQVFVLVVVGALAGVTAGKVIPSLPGMSSVNAVNAASLDVKALAPIVPVGSGFTYQGQLIQSGSPATGQFDFQFTLYDALVGGTQVGSPVQALNTTVTNGLFTLTLDFGATAFDGNARYLLIEVKVAGGPTYTALTPRQALTPAPYAQFAAKTTPLKNVVTVAQSGGQFTTITAALNSITDNSATNQYLIRVGPGTYSETVTMKPFVDIEGSGELTTKITFIGSASNTTGTVVGASNAELRSLTVENTGGNSYAIAIYNNSAAPSLLHVTATASGGSSNNVGVLNFNGSSPSMTNVTATASGASNSNFGVDNFNSSSPSMTNVTVTASGAAINNYGVYNSSISSPKIVTSIISASGGTTNYGVYSQTSGTVTIDSSKITGSTNTINNGAGVITRVGASQLSGGAVTNGGTLTCSASYASNGIANEPLNAKCVTKQMIDNVVTVGQSGADFTTITAALNFIADASATNHYVIKVAPGTYSERVTMKQFVDIEGSGELTTKITFTGSPGFNTGTVVGANNAELRSLTVQNTGGNLGALAIYNSSASPSLLHVTANASGGSSENFGVYNYSSSPSMTNVTATASGGTYNRGVYNQSSSPTMTNVTATASGASTVNYGVYNSYSSSPSMTNVTATASGGSSNIGVYNYSSSSPSMTDVTATASGVLGTTTYGVLNDTSSPKIVTSIISASGGTTNYGVYSDGSGTVTIDRSKITASSNTIVNNSVGVTTRVGASKLSGGPVFNGGGTLTCSASYNENYVSPGLNVCP